MKSLLLRFLTSIIVVAAFSLTAYGQGGSTSSLSGAVVDPTGDVVPGATVVVKSNATGVEFKATAAGNGTFSIPALDAGTYTVTISAPGFKQAIITDVKVDAGIPASVRVGLEVGSTTESVVVQGGGEVLQTQSANIATTLNVNQIASLPLVSRNPINFIPLMPGVSTPRNNRDSTINGLPEGAISIFLDGINIQDNFNKTTDGLFTRVPPSLDSVQEVTISTATPEAQGGGQGAVQIKFVTRQGTNEFHGSLYEYHRNPWLNSNYWFSNRDQAPIHEDTGLTCTAANYDPDKCHAPRARVLFNQYGGRLGGPIVIPKLFNGRNRAFFFVNYEEFRQPNQVTRQRTIFNQRTQQGIFRYNVTVGGQTQVREVNLLEVAQRATAAGCTGCTTTIDPVVGKLLSDIRNSTANTGGITALTDPNLERFTFNPSGKNYSRRPTVRFDVNLTDNHRLEATWTYLQGRGGPDFLNGREPRFPGFPNVGSQPADRYTGSLAARSTLTPTLVNEARAGLSGGPSRFFPDANAAQFSGTVANQAGFSLGIDAAGITSATNTTAPSRRNPLLRDFSDTLTWTRGAHSLTFGGQYTQLNLTLQNQTLVPSITFGINTNDPANVMFNATNGPVNFPGAASADITRAANIYAVLTGHVTAINANARLNEKTGKYEYLAIGVQRGRQRELGFFAQDSWRARPNLTLNYGLRWEMQGSFIPRNNSYSTVSGVGDLFGVSGPGNLFKPGTLTGRVTQFVQFKEGDKSYNLDYKNFAPSFGFAWTPSAKDGWLRTLVGDSGQTVVRGGYSIAYNRNGLGDFSGVFGANPGLLITANRDLTIGNLVTNVGNDRLPVLLRETSRLGPPAIPSAPTYPLTGSPFVAITDSANIFDPNIKVPYSQSWSFGIQREITKDMAVEVRYVGTRNLRGWTTYNLNSVEFNVLENGLLNEFKLAQANLRANIAAGRGNTFRYFGPNTGTSPLPIILAYFSGVPAAQANDPARYTSTLFSNATFVNPLALNNPNLCCSTAAANPSFAFSLHNDATRRANALRAGLPANFFLTNPDLRGGVNFTGNGGYTRYDSLQVEFRRRLSQGLLIQSNYTWAKAFSSSRYSFRAPRVNTPDDGSPGYIAHAFKVNWVYELPIGKGKTLFGNAGGLLDRIVGGWEFHGTGRVQSGEVLNFGNVNLVGMTMKDLQKVFKLRFDDANKVVYHLPQDIIDNTIKAFSTSATSATGYGSLGAPTGRYFAPAGGPNCIEVVRGGCAPQNVYVTGPMFARFDMSAVKRVRITEGANFELRAEFLNAFNNINFFANTNMTNFNQATFGQVTSAYTDPNNTQDPGGRLVQIVLRFNF
jgi:hypothetical protein